MASVEFDVRFDMSFLMVRRALNGTVRYSKCVL